MSVGFRDEFASFWRREHEGLYRALGVVLGDESLAREACDEAMIRAFQRWELLRGYDDPAAWVFRVAMNWAVSWRRKLALRPTRAREELDREHRDRRADVDVVRALGRLSAEQRAVVVLRFYLDWPLERIAGAVEAPVGTVKSRLHRALEVLRTSEEVGA